MNVFTWVCLGLFVCALFLYLLGCFKDFVILSKISRLFLIPSSTFIAVPLLIAHFPDSMHIFYLTVIALGCIILSELMRVFEKIKFFDIAFKFFFFVSSLAWLELYRSTFFIYIIPMWINIIGCCVYGILYILICVWCGKKPLYFYLGLLLIYAPLVCLNYSAVITLIFNPQLYSSLLFAGTLTLLMTYTFYAIHKSKEGKLREKIITITMVSLLVIAENLITFSGLLMIR